MDGEIYALKAKLMRLDEKSYSYDEIKAAYSQSVRIKPYDLKNRLSFTRYLMSHGDYELARDIIESGWGHYYDCNFSYIHEYLSQYMEVRKHFGQSVDFLSELIVRIKDAQKKHYQCAGIFVNKSMLLTL